jgi:beta-phosphoglucomutase
MFIKQFVFFVVSICSFMFTANAPAYQALIFDCDGVLVDSEQLKFKAWQSALADIKIDFQEKEYLPLVGYDSQHIARAIADLKLRDFDKKALIIKKDRIYHQLQKQGVKPIQNAVLFLKQALSQKKKLGLKIAIASSAARSEIIENLQQLGVEPTQFDFIISGKDDLKHIQDPHGVNKPKPYIYQICAKTLNVAPKQCLVFEDSSAGVLAASAAGMDVIAIPNAFTQHQDFSAALKIATFKEIDITTLTTH